MRSHSRSPPPASMVPMPWRPRRSLCLPPTSAAWPETWRWSSWPRGGVFLARRHRSEDHSGAGEARVPQCFRGQGTAQRPGSIHRHLRRHPSSCSPLRARVLRAHAGAFRGLYRGASLEGIGKPQRRVYRAAGRVAAHQGLRVVHSDDQRVDPGAIWGVLRRILSENGPRLCGHLHCRDRLSRRHRTDHGLHGLDHARRGR